MQKLLASLAALAAILAAWGTLKKSTPPAPASSTFVADSVCTGGRLLQMRAVDSATAELVGDTLFVAAVDTNARYHDTTAAFRIDSGATMQLLAYCVAPPVRYRPVPALPVPRANTSKLVPMGLEPPPAITQQKIT